MCKHSLLLLGQRLEFILPLINWISTCSRRYVSYIRLVSEVPGSSVTYPLFHQSASIYVCIGMTAKHLKRSHFYISNSHRLHRGPLAPTAAQSPGRRAAWRRVSGLMKRPGHMWPCRRRFFSFNPPSLEEPEGISPIHPV